MSHLGDQWVGFWHAVGPHGGEFLPGIIAQKKQDIVKFDEALWAFKRFKEPYVERWRDAITAAKPADVLVFCSRRVDVSGKDRNRDTGKPVAHTHRRDSSAVPAVPIKCRVTSSKSGDCAFVVSKIEEIVEGSITRTNCSKVMFFFPRQNVWSEDCRRGQRELLVKPDAAAIKLLMPSSGRVKVTHILHLVAPYVTWVGGPDVQVGGPLPIETPSSLG